MKTRITQTRAQEIASHWHDGQWSALYSFTSTGEFHIRLTLQYFKEIQTALEPQYWHARAIYRTSRETTELKALQNYLLVKAKENGVAVIFHPHEVYGYQIPYLADNVSPDLEKQVKPVTYLP